ncbi:uncharacterized protein LOC122383099 [Amphibalanus amphitrite]|uniref:uncharacterized protein LOC122383099 n=1 Tax=Amphibalanus amphitrite TaxID=1232801 RepID=UPI001C903F2C|nr:uncharacterized protein LOC122383099 [Amphibalanus amphitrite]
MAESATGAAASSADSAAANEGRLGESVAPVDGAGETADADRADGSEQVGAASEQGHRQERGATGDDGAQPPIAPQETEKEQDPLEQQELDEAQLSPDSDEGEGVNKELPDCKLKRTYYCKKCPFTTRNPREFLYHQKDVHSIRLQINECPHCIYASRCKLKLNRHLRMVHEDAKPAKMEESQEKGPLTIVSEPSPVREEEDEEGIEEEEVEESLYSLKDYGDMDGEILKEEDVRDEPQTSRSSKSRSELKKKFYRCSKCQYMTHIKSRFTKHVKYHSMPMIKCELCEFRTPYKWNLDRHMKNHTGSGEFQCNQCSFSAHIKQSLTVHIQNHHLPASQVLEKLRAKCNVGGSDAMDHSGSEEVLDVDEEELLRLEREEDSEDEETEKEVRSKEPAKPKVKPTARKTAPASRSNADSAERHDFDKDFVHPDDVVERNGRVYIKDLKCSVCSYKTLYEKDLLRHEYSQHGVVRNGIIPPVFTPPQKPSPVAAPGRTGAATATSVASTASSTAVSPASSAAATSGSSSATGSSSTEKPKPKRPPPSLIPLQGRQDKDGEGAAEAAEDAPADGDSPEAVAMNERAERAAEEFLSARSDGAGPQSVLDRLFTQKMAAAGASDTTKADEPKLASGERQASRPTSTRCQYCRHRCKTTDDLRTHQKSCPEAPASAATAGAEADSQKQVFVWNSASGSGDAPSEGSAPAVREGRTVAEAAADDEGGDASHADNGSPQTRSHGPPTRGDGEAKLVTRRVFKCPNCTFWATTASRFHVHLVGHMNMKPYECTECGYRSNWRWDITKHIKLKSAKDRSHLRAKLFINDGGSTRDYDKYDIYLEYMQVEEGLQCKPQISSSVRKRSSPGSLGPQPGSSPLSAPSVSPRPPLPLRPGVPVPPNVTVRSPFGSTLPLYEPPLIGNPPLARMPMPPRLTRAPLGPARPGAPPPPFRPAAAFKQPVLDLPFAARGVLLPGVRLPGVPVSGVPGVVRPLAPAPSLESLKRMDPTLAAMGITDENTAIVMPEPPPDAAAGQGSGQGGAGGAKKPTVWRCKKCNFKHADREVVRAHYRSHNAPYMCGHCGQGSKWKHVLQRHCRMKHNGNVSVVENRVETEGGPGQQQAQTQKQRASSDVTISVVNKQGGNGSAGASFRCDICSYTCANNDETISAHMQHHTPQPGATFKCILCPFYVSTKKALSDHMLLHGVTSPQQFVTQKGPNSTGCTPSTPTAQQFEPVDFIQAGPAEAQSANKPFRCTQCPFATDQKSQFQYHRQYHVPRGMPYRCPACSYSVQQRSHLIAHARLHGLQPRPGATSGDKPKRALLKPERSTVAGPVLRDADTRHMDEVPLVWVSRGGKFFKMFKCRQCPHVNLRKSNIQDHEKMHTDRDLAGYAHRCTKCNYVCINAGVLSGHLKVHTYWLGKIHAVVDMKRSDEEQLREILGEDAASDVEVVLDRSLPAPVATSSASSGPAAAAADTASATDSQRILYFCQHCPARFFHDNEIKIHSRFHGMNLPFTCQKCSYTARQHPHLLAHLKVHSEEYRDRTRSLLLIYTSSPDHPPRGAAPAQPPAPPASQATPSPKRTTPSPAPGTASSPATVMAAAGQPDVPAPSASPYQPAAGADTAPAAGTEPETTPTAGAESSPSRASPTPKTAWKVKRFTCSQCPARFVKEATLRYHISLHGSNGPFRCDRCNYAVKTYGNLVQHLNLHTESDLAGDTSSRRSSPDADVGRFRASANDFPMSGVDLLKRKLDFEKEHLGELNENNLPSRKVMRFAPPSMDPTSPYYAERAGNPDFAYPTVLDRYGREREKRYKCRRCPSAFEKREQYIKHINLHGVQNRYTCSICDYSVKYYPNFCNHMKRHGIRPPPMDEAASATVSGQDSGSNSPRPGGAGDESPRPAGGRGAAFTGAPELTTAERQQLVLQRVREEQDALKEDSEPPRKVHWCELCPYANVRRDTTENHRWRHLFYGGPRGPISCGYCDFSAQQSHLMRDHYKVHFRPCKYIKVESYTELVKLEVFMKEVNVQEEDAEILEDACEDVDVSTHDVLFAASDWDETRPEPELTPGEPPVLVDVFTGDFVSEKRAENGETADRPEDEPDQKRVKLESKEKEASPDQEAAARGDAEDVAVKDEETSEDTDADKDDDVAVNATEEAVEDAAGGADAGDSAGVAEDGDGADVKMEVEGDEDAAAAAEDSLAAETAEVGEEAGEDREEDTQAEEEDIPQEPLEDPLAAD